MHLIAGRGGGSGDGILLREPVLRYAGPLSSSGHGGTRREGPVWKCGDDSRWTYSDGSLILGAGIDAAPDHFPAGSSILRVTATSLEPVSVGLCAFAFEVRSLTPPYFADRRLRWGRLRGTAHVNDFGPCAVRWNPSGGTAMELRMVRGTVSSRLTWKRRRLEIAFTLDSAALHPRWQFSAGANISTAAHSWEAGETMTLSFLFSGADGVEAAPPIAGRFPDGAEAGFALTDHCDFDSNDRLHVFLEGDERHNGWLGRGLRMTKGVFTLTSAVPDRTPVPTLADSRYRELIQALRRDGSEIAPHALSEVGTVSPPVFREAVRQFSSKWSPATWIDHGNTIGYCYTMGGAADPAYDLLGVLRSNGFTALWSYHDIPVHGSATLNLLDAPHSAMGAMGRRSASHARRGEVLVAMHYLRSMLERGLRGRWGRVVMVVIPALRGYGMKVARTRKIAPGELMQTLRQVRTRARQALGAPGPELREPYTRRELAECGAVVYPERGVPLHQASESEQLLFATIEGVHTRDIYTPDALDRLLSERGLHVGHCYLLNRLPYIAGVFERGTEPGRLTDAWTEFIASLDRSVASRRLWNPTAGDLSAWMRDMQAISVIPGKRGRVDLHHPGSGPVRGFTLLLARTVPPASVRWGDAAAAGWRYWRDWLAVWGDLPAASHTVVQWEDPIP